MLLVGIKFLGLFVERHVAVDFLLRRYIQHSSGGACVVVAVKVQRFVCV